MHAACICSAKEEARRGRGNAMRCYTIDLQCKLKASCMYNTTYTHDTQHRNIYLHHHFYSSVEHVSVSKPKLAAEPPSPSIIALLRLTSPRLALRLLPHAAR